VTRLRVGRPGIDSQQGNGFFSPRYHAQIGSRAYPASYLMGAGVKRPGREAGFPVPRIIMRGAITPLPSMLLWRGA